MEGIRLYNTMTGALEPFEPIEAGRVGMYHCGPTVYQRPHIGNYRAFLFADLLRRFFESEGYRVRQVMNITDVGHLTQDDTADATGEDKLIAEAARAQVDPWELSQQVTEQFLADLAALGVLPAHHYPRATEHIDEMVAQVETLIQKGNAYQVGENIYFDVHSFPNYGKLSGNRVEDLEAGARLEVNEEKRHPADFALWKSDANHVMKWATSFGPHGFPGWHIECSAMSMKYLGERFDLHTGGEDNVFPHHECEIAQAECVTGAPFVNYWMHTKFLRVDGGKMSKSLGNVYSLDDLSERGFDPLDFRFLVLRAHYRAPLNFTWDVLRAARESRLSLQDLRGRLRALSQGAAAEPSEVVEQAEAAFRSSMACDLNCSPAVAALFDLRSSCLQGGFTAGQATTALAFLSRADAVLGLFGAPSEGEGGPTDEEIAQMVVERDQARADRDFARSDELRDALQAAGIVLEDSPDGTRWHRK